MERWEPFRELRRMDRDMDRLWRGWPFRHFEHELDHWHVPLDVFEEDDKVVVRADVPGFKPEEIELSVEDDRLIIKGETKEEHEEKKGEYLMRERRAGKFHREFRLPNADMEKAEPRFEDGVLTITFPKVEAKKAKRLEIKAA